MTGMIQKTSPARLVNALTIACLNLSSDANEPAVPGVIRGPALETGNVTKVSPPPSLRRVASVGYASRRKEDVSQLQAAVAILRLGSVDAGAFNTNVTMSTAAAFAK